MQYLTNNKFDLIFDLLNYRLFALGEATITPLSILYIILLLIGLFYVSGKVRRILVGNLLARTNLDSGVQQAIGTITKYVVLFVGVLIIFQTVGVDLTALTVIAGAVGVGIGFGLQNVANNFISGLIILIERPIEVGDRIEVNDVTGDVISIGARSTTIKTNDSIAIIVPNSKFISEKVTNWSFSGGMVRFRIPVSVPGDSDFGLVTKLLMQIAHENEDVVETPSPSINLLKIGAKAQFELRAWSKSKLHRPGQFISSINGEIARLFREHEIQLVD